MAQDQDIGAAAREAGRELRHRRTGMPSFVELAVFLVLLAIGVSAAVYVGNSFRTAGRPLQKQ